MGSIQNLILTEKFNPSKLDFLNNLSEHLITYDSWYRFARASDLPNEHDRVAELEQVIEDLPQANRDTLAFMVLHLQRIAETTECRMPASNLARVFGPSLVGNSSPNLPAADIINEVKTQHQIVEALIRLPASFYLQFVETGEQQQQRYTKFKILYHYIPFFIIFSYF